MIAGIHVYGAIKNVAGTRIVTTFFMLMGLPLIPGFSMYYLGQGQQHGAILPVVGGFTQQDLLGVVCRRIDWLSVFVGYIRAYGTALIIVGAFGLLCLVCLSLGPNAGNPFETVLPVVLGSLLAVGSLAVALTYVIGRRVPADEMFIRSVCQDVFGVAADPADVHRETALAWRLHIENQLAVLNADANLCTVDSCGKLSPEVARLQLLLARIVITDDAIGAEAKATAKAIVRRLMGAED